MQFEDGARAQYMKESEYLGEPDSAGVLLDFADPGSRDPDSLAELPLCQSLRAAQSAQVQRKLVSGVQPKRCFGAQICLRGL